MSNRTHLFRGELLSDQELDAALASLSKLLAQDLLCDPPPCDLVLDAIGGLHSGIDWQTVRDAFAQAGAGGFAAELVREAQRALHPDALSRLLRDELGEEPFVPKQTRPGIYQMYAPLGVLIHIAAGNTPGLGALSALEGLLTGNINLVKPPSGDDGFTARLLHSLCIQEPRLKPYLYVLDISSADQERIKSLLALGDGVAVWGSDEAVAAIRMLAPPSVPLIEWGHRLSFAYARPDATNENALLALAEDICKTEQRLCTAPQCAIIDTDSLSALSDFAAALAGAMRIVSPRYPKVTMDIHQMADVTLSVQTALALQAAGRRKVLSGPEGEWHLIIDPESTQPQVSPLHRVLPIIGIPEDCLMEALRPMHGHLQTVGLLADPPHRQRLAGLLLRAGATNITRPGYMSQGTLADPRDGQSPLSRYVRRVRTQEGEGNGGTGERGTIGALPQTPPRA